MRQGKPTLRLVSSAAQPVWTEAERLSALDSYHVLDTPPEPSFDDIAKIAAHVCGAPIAAVNFIAEHRQWFKSEIGLGVRETPLDVSICARAILQRGLFVVPDTTLDPRFSSNPLVTGEPYLRFYAGALLETRDGLPLGTLCVLDHAPRPSGLTPEQAFTLEALARRVMTELELRRALARQARLEQEARDREDHYRHVVELNPQVPWTADAHGNILDFSQRWLDLTGLTRGEALGGGWTRAANPDDLPRMTEAWTASVATGQPYDIEHRIRLADGACRWMRSRAYPRRDRTGAVVRWYGSTEDIHDRKLGEQQQRLLVHELNHRVKNTLATVQSLAVQSFRGTNHASQAREQFEARLLALSRAHNVLTRENWESADLHAIIADVITPFCGDGERVHADGSHLSLPPNMALALAMALHELCTNACQHGALSTPNGSVAIAWTRTLNEPPRLVLNWRERGGAPPNPPGQRGFGTRLLERTIQQELGGEVRASYEAEGVTCLIDVPMPHCEDVCII